MFTESAALYDLIYSSFKDYPAEARQLAALLRDARPRCRTVLDAGCGTAEHARLLGEVHGFDVDGIDLDPAFVTIATAKVPRGRFHVADMTDFDLGRTYDAVICLFGSIAYTRTLPRLRDALARLRAHVVPDGVVIVEPFLTPAAITPGFVDTRSASSGDLRVTRTSRSDIEGRLFRLHFEYVIEEPAGIRRSSEVHELGLFTIEEMLEGFSAAGLAARYDNTLALSGRGLYVASPAA
jgi:SAM-dependent methyltransferase